MNYHLTDIFKIAGTLGTGLFLGSGGALSGAGPLGALIAYMLVGTVAYSYVIRAPRSQRLLTPTPQVAMCSGRDDLPRSNLWYFPPFCSAMGGSRVRFRRRLGMFGVFLLPIERSLNMCCF